MNIRIRLFQNTYLEYFVYTQPIYIHIYVGIIYYVGGITFITLYKLQDKELHSSKRLVEK